MGFARYERASDGTPEAVVAAALRWQEEFLSRQDGILFHAFLGNLRGGFADVILATDEAAFDQMSRRHPEAESSHGLMQMLNRESIRLSKSLILKERVRLPTDFSCVEFGTFRVADPTKTTAAAVRAASDHIEATYLRGSTNTCEHFVGQIDHETYCEVAFGRTLADTRRTCAGYVGHVDCQPLLDLFPADGVDLDFWYLLA